MFNFTFSVLLCPVSGSRLVQEGGTGDPLALVKETSPGARKVCSL